jgi:hypothetical protein
VHEQKRTGKLGFRARSSNSSLLFRSRAEISCLTKTVLLTGRVGMRVELLQGPGHMMVMNVGNRPTFVDGDGLSVEAHVMHEYSRDFHGAWPTQFTRLCAAVWSHTSTSMSTLSRCLDAQLYPAI